MFNEFQSYLPFKENTFYTFTDETLGYVKALILYKDECTRNKCTAIFRVTLKAFIAKYYVNGFKLNNKITYNCKAVSHCRMINPEYGYTKLETIVVMKSFRAFRDFAYSEFEKEDEFIDKLVKASRLLG